MKASVDAFKQAHGRGEAHYITSFCATKDLWISQNGLLSQWRGYGLDGGYAIVFDRAEMGKLLDRESKIYHEERLSLGEVQYRLGDDVSVSDTKVLEHIRRIRDAVSEYYRTKNIEQLYPAFYSNTLLSGFCKHRGFEEEHEVRIVIAEPSIEMGPDPQKPGGKPYRKAHSYLRNGAAVPCIHLFEDQSLESLPIRRIIVGPHPDKQERKKSVEILLHNPGIDAEVLVSDTPFRGR